MLPTGKARPAPGAKGAATEHPIREEHNRVRQTCFRTLVAFARLIGLIMRRPLASKIYLFITAESGRDPPPTALVVARTMPLYANIGKSPLGAAQSHRLRRFLQACRAHRRVSSPAAADG